MTQERIPDITIVILTFNEELHIRRVIESALAVTNHIIIVDSFSTDQTVLIAKDLRAIVFQHPFVNYAEQLNWALENCNILTPWTMRFDADEYLTPELISEMKQKLRHIPDNITGIVLKRRVYFMGKWIRHGGYYPIQLLRIWRSGMGRCETRWMDEHMVLSEGDTIQFNHDFIDENLNNLTWWTDKHNHYSTRETIDLLNTKYDLLKSQPEIYSITNTQNKQKRWFKENLYARLPLFLRAWLYFMYRYFIQLGFLDGRKGLVWHFLQGFWYRFLVDAKILQIEWMAKRENKSIKQILEEKYGVRF